MEFNYSSSFFRKLCKLLHLNIFNLNNSENYASGTILYFSRNGLYKIFDTDNKKVFSVVKNRDQIDKLKHIYAFPFFKYFNFNRIQELSINNQFYIIEDYNSSPDFAKLCTEKKTDAYLKTIDLYKKYAIKEGKRGVNVLDYKKIFYSITRRLDINFESFIKYEEFEDILSRSLWVPTHFDFNPSNLKYDNYITVLDNEDFGIEMPAYYDIINLAYNDLRYHNSSEWIAYLFNNQVFSKLQTCFEDTIINFKKEEIYKILLTYFILAHSQIVHETLNIEMKSDIGSEFLKFNNYINQSLKLLAK